PDFVRSFSHLGDMAEHPPLLSEAAHSESIHGCLQAAGIRVQIVDLLRGWLFRRFLQKFSQLANGFPDSINFESHISTPPLMKITADDQSPAEVLNVSQA